jgi:hypothetical protein
VRRLLLATACLFVGAMVAAVRVTNAVLDRLDEAERDGQVVPHRLPAPHPTRPSPVVGSRYGS